MGLKLFLHGVPDTPAMWQPLITALGLEANEYRAPKLPGFASSVAPGFNCTKEAYVNWYIREIEKAVAYAGPVDLVGHDWGALITVRAASRRPDLVNSWCASNALPHPDYQWHRMAKLWQTPVIGELVMMFSNRKKLADALNEAGMPAEMAAQEVSHWNRTMRSSILKLYRSARHAGDEWWDELENLPKQGLVFWGEDDPFVPLWVAEKFCDHTGADLIRQPKTGHWSVVERAEELAQALQTHWA